MGYSETVHPVTIGAQEMNLTFQNKSYDHTDLATDDGERWFLMRFEFRDLVIRRARRLSKLWALRKVMWL